jgi:hypothetical protein
LQQRHVGRRATVCEICAELETVRAARGGGERGVERLDRGFDQDASQVEDVL